MNNIKEEDFPLYQLLVKLDLPGVERAKSDFSKAVTGGDDERYRFALGIQTIVAIPDAERLVPGLTKDIKDKTLQSCLSVFEEAASHGHEKAAFMARYYKAHAMGTAPKS